MNNETMHCPGCCDQVGCIGNDLHICGKEASIIQNGDMSLSQAMERFPGIKREIETQRSKDIKKISYMFAIPEDDIYKALGAKEERHV